MRHPGPHHAPRAASLLAGLGGLCLVACVLLPIARVGIGSATPLRGLSDLILAGALRAHVPAWTGMFGYLPALAGVGVLLAEPLSVRLRQGLRWVAIVVAVLSLGALLWLVPWESVGDLGSGLRLGLAGLALSFAAATTDEISRRRARRVGPPSDHGTGHHQPGSPVNAAPAPPGSRPPTTSSPMNGRRHHVLPAVRH